MKEVIVDAEDLVCLNKEKLQELIRCKDCKYNPKQMLVGCPLAGSPLRNDNWYCAWAERKE